MHELFDKINVWKTTSWPTPSYPENDSYLARLARQEHRAGRHREALALLGRWDVLHRERFGSSAPVCVGLLALSHHHLDQAAPAAKAALERLRGLMRNDWCAADTEAAGLYRQARQTIGEAPTDATVEAIKSTFVTMHQAGHARHERATFMQLLTDDYQSVFGRNEKPGPYDLVSDREKVEAVLPLRFHGRFLNWRRGRGPRYRRRHDNDFMLT